VPSLRVNIQVLASHFTPQESKAAAPPARWGSRRRAREKTKPQHALEPACSLELCVCVCGGGGNCSTPSVWAPS
jgi:hypothetical protein